MPALALFLSRFELGVDDAKRWLKAILATEGFAVVKGCSNVCEPGFLHTRGIQFSALTKAEESRQSSTLNLEPSARKVLQGSHMSVQFVHSICNL